MTSSTTQIFEPSSPSLTNTDMYGNFRRGVCPNVDALQAVYSEGLMTKADCVDRCAISVDECNQALNTDVRYEDTCNEKVCSRRIGSSTPIAIRPHNNKCKGGEFCKECCIGKCLVDEQTLNMTCFLNCIDGDCELKQKVASSTTAGVGDTPPPDILIPITIPTEIQPLYPDSDDAEKNSMEWVWIFLIVVLGLAAVGLGIYSIRSKKMHNVLKKINLHKTPKN